MRNARELENLLEMSKLVWQALQSALVSVSTPLDTTISPIVEICWPFYLFRLDVLGYDDHQVLSRLPKHRS